MPYYQPIVNNLTRRIDHYECLIRLIDREGKLVLPVQFLEVAKRTRLYPRLTRTVIARRSRSSATTAIRSRSTSGPGLPEPGLRQVRALRALRESRGAGQDGFEILESEGIENYEPVSELIRQMKALGCRIALDDFGSGYSNFEQVLRLKLDCIKIDGSLVRDICTEAGSRLIVENLVGMCRKLGIPTVAEYVHSEEVLRAVLELGVDYSQGFYLGRPEPAMRQETEGAVHGPPAVLPLPAPPAGS